jgi:uncharacterized protein YqeY
MKERNPERDILRVYLGKLQEIESREGGDKLTDDRCIAVARNIINGNNDAIQSVITEGKTPPAEWKEKLDAENAVMQTFLPNYITADEIKAAFDTATVEAIKKAQNDKAAMGVAMKFLKSKPELKVEGNTVKDVVAAIWHEGR